MTRKIYRTAQGRMVDLGALQLQNENVRAVGNMGVNARGDLLNADNQPISTRNKQVSKQYRQQTTSNVSKSSVRSSQQDTVKELIEIASDEDLEEISNYAQDQALDIEKSLWMLNSTLG